MGLLGFFLGIVGLIGGVLYPYLFSFNLLLEVIFLTVSVIGFFTSIMGIKTGRTASGVFGIIFSVLAIICCALLIFGGSKVKEWTGLDFFKEGTPAAAGANGANDDALTEDTTTAEAPADKTPADKEADILGSWKYVSGNYTYQFNKDLTGTYTMGESVMDFTYETKDGKLSILYSGSTSPLVLEYSIDGDTLNVKDSNGNDTIYKKK